MQSRGSDVPETLSDSRLDGSSLVIHRFRSDTTASIHVRMNLATIYGLIGNVIWFFRSPRITFDPSPVNRIYQSDGRPS